MRTVDGDPLDLTLTTNGSLLGRKAKALKAAGLKRVTVSLDGLDDAVFRRMNDVDFPVAEVLAGIDAARDAGLGPIKINMVVKRGTNEHEILPMARHFKGSGIVLRKLIQRPTWRLSGCGSDRHCADLQTPGHPSITVGSRARSACCCCCCCCCGGSRGARSGWT